MIGYSFTRFVEFPCGITYCFSVFKVVVIIQNVPSILYRHLSAHTVIVHAGANDVMARQLIKLQSNFECLTTTLKSLGKACILSGPIPSRGLSTEHFSRIFSLHCWVQNFCTATGFCFFFFCFFFCLTTLTGFGQTKAWLVKMGFTQLNWVLSNGLLTWSIL